MLLLAIAIVIVLMMVIEGVSEHRERLKEDVEYRYFELVEIALWYPTDDIARLRVTFEDAHDIFNIAAQKAHKWYCDVSKWENEAEKVHDSFMKRFEG